MTLEVVQIPRRFTTSSWGGTETYVLELARRLRGRGVSTDILCSAALSRPGRDMLGGIPIERTPYFYPYVGLGRAARIKLDHKGGNLFSNDLFLRLMSRARLDVIHLHTGKRLGGIARLAARLRGIPYVVTLHGGCYDIPADEEETYTQPTRATIEWGKALGFMVGSRRVLDDAAAIVCVGQAEQRKVAARFPAKEVMWLPGGVDIERFAAGDRERGRRALQLADPEGATLLCVGRLDPQKNQLTLVRMLPGLRARKPGTQLVLVGPTTDEAYAQEVRREISTLGLESAVRLIPGIAPDSQDLVDLYHAADLFVLPSRHEPFGLVMLEAWAAGLPTVAYGVGGIPGFATHRRDALIAPPGEPRELSELCFELLLDQALAARLRESARATVHRHHSWEARVDRVHSLYRRIREPLVGHISQLPRQKEPGASGFSSAEQETSPECR